MLVIGIYVKSTNLIENSSGIGKHTKGMIKSLIRNKKIKIVLFGSKDLIISNDSPFKNLEFFQIPINTKYLELSWKLFNYPFVDQYLPKLDFIYVPGEELVATKNIDVYFTLHDVYQFLESPYSLRKYLLYLRYYKYLKGTKKIITVSSNSKNHIIKNFKIQCKKILTLGNSIGFSTTNCSPSNLKLEQDYIVIGGPINEKKGGINIINLCRSLKKRFPKIKIFITGGISKKFIKIFESLKLSNTKVFLHNQLNDQEMIKLLKNAICYLQMSKFEGFGMMIIEAMYLKTPTIINDIPVLLDITAGNSIVCNNKNTNEIINYIDKLINDNEYRYGYIQRAYLHSKKFNWNNYSNKLVDSMVLEKND